MATTRYIHDNLGRVIRIEHLTNNPPQNVVTTFEFDAEARVVAINNEPLPNETAAQAAINHDDQLYNHDDNELQQEPPQNDEPNDAEEVDNFQHGM